MVDDLYEHAAVKQFYVYILASRRNGTLYIGVTSDLVVRIAQHKAKIAGGFTARYGCDRLVYSRCSTRPRRRSPARSN
jgi:putative endonuclease